MSTSAIKKLNVAVIGDVAVGKTWICKRFQNDSIDDSSPTVGIGMFKKIEVINDVQYEIDLFDTPGQQELSQITDSALKGKDLIIVVYDLTKKETYDRVADCIKRVESLSESKMILLGNKCDMEKEKFEMSEEEENKYQSKFLFHRKVSAKTGDGVRDAIIDGIKDVLGDVADNSQPIKKRKDGGNSSGCC